MPGRQMSMHCACAVRLRGASACASATHRSGSATSSCASAVSQAAWSAPPRLSDLVDQMLERCASWRPKVRRSPRPQGMISGRSRQCCARKRRCSQETWRRNPGEIAGFGMIADPRTSTAPDRWQWPRAQASLSDALITPADVHYITAHCTRPYRHDRTETERSRRVRRAREEAIDPATKSMIALLSALRGIADGRDLMSLRDGVIRRPHYLGRSRVRLATSNEARDRNRAALSNSFAFGGSMPCSRARTLSSSVFLSSFCLLDHVAGGLGFGSTEACRDFPRIELAFWPVFSAFLSACVRYGGALSRHQPFLPLNSVSTTAAPARRWPSSGKPRRAPHP